MRHCGQRRVHQPVPDRFPVRPVAQVHYGLLQVGQAAPAPFHQDAHVFQGAGRLAHHVPRMDNVSLRVNTGGAGKEIMGAVPVHNTDAALKGHPVHMRGGQVVRRFHVPDLPGLQPRDAQTVHMQQAARQLRTAFNAGTGDEMALRSQPVTVKASVAAFHQSPVVVVNIPAINPGAVNQIRHGSPL